MTKIRRLSVILTVIIMTTVLTVVPIMSANALYYFDGDKMIDNSGYKYYRAWSQDQFPWHNTKPTDAWEYDWMNRYGCSTVAMAKMFVEAGVANPYTTTPGTLMTKYGSPSKGIGDVGIYWSTLAGQFGMTCDSFQYYPTGGFYNTAMRFFNRTDKQFHLLLKVSLSHGGSHYVQVDRQATIDKGELIYNDSTNTSDGGTRYNSAKEYYNNLALKKLSNASFTPEYFVVFSHKGFVALKSIKEVNSTTAQLSWYPNGCCEKYIVYRRNKGESSWTGKRVAYINSVSVEGVRSYKDTSLVMGKAYEYTVRGYYKSNGKTTYLGYNKKGLSVRTHPDAPKLKGANSIDHNTIEVSWNKMKNADGYKVYRKQVGDKKWRTIANGVKNTYYKDTTAVTGTKYYYTVRAYVGDKNFLGSYNKTGVKGVALPAKAEMVKAESLDFNKIKITWKKVPGVTGYIIYRKSPSDKVYKDIGEVYGAKNVSFTDLSAVTGTKYTYTVRAYKKVKNTKYQGKYDTKGIIGKAYTCAPNIKSSTSSAWDKLTLNWSKVNGAGGYIVYRKTDGDKSYSKVKEISGNGNTNFTDKNLKCCVKYLYKVKGYRTVSNKKCPGYSSKEKAAYTRPGEPGLKSTQSVDYSTIKLSWTKVSGATSYIVYRKDGDKYKKLSQVDATKNNTQSYSDKTAVTGVKYTYAVRAVCEANNMTKYSTLENYIYGTAYPNAPKMENVQILEYNSLMLKWKKVSGADGYYIYRKLPTDKKYTKILTVKGGNTLSCTDKKASCGVNYMYVSKAYRTVDGKNYFSPCSSAVKGRAVPATPDVKVENNGYNSLSVIWNKVSGADGYRVYYKKYSAKDWLHLATFDNGDLTSCVQKELITGVKYSYTVRAFHKDKKSTVWGLYDKKGVSNVPLPTAPVLTEAKAVQYNTINVFWKNVPGATGYVVYRKLPLAKKWDLLARIKGDSVLNYSDKTVSCAVKYLYTVRAYRTVGGVNKYGYYDGRGISGMTLPTQPTISAKSVSYNKIKLSWSSCPGANGFKIYRKTANGKYDLYRKITAKTITTYTDTVECGVEYYYYVTAYTTVDRVEYGSYDSREEKCRAVPETPSLNSATSTEPKEVNLKWGSVPGASGYYIYRKDPGTTSYKLIYDTQSSSVKSFKDVNVESGKKYTYTVKAYRICPAGYIAGNYKKSGITVTVK